MVIQVTKKNKASPLDNIYRPIFVVGCCNSGTTILWKTLLSHPDLSGPSMEGQDIKELPMCMKHSLGKQTFRMFVHPKFNNLYHLTEKDFDEVTSERLAAVYAEHCEPGKRFIEKSPANSMRTRFLQSIFPDATFIIIVRNGIAIAEGIRRRRLFDPDRQHMAGLNTTIDEAAHQWSNANRILLEDRKYLKRSLFLTYEDLVNNTELVFQKVLDFCELDSQGFSIPSFEKNHNSVQIARLTEEEIKLVTGIEHSLLVKFGYNYVDADSGNMLLVDGSAEI
jgi:sulfotransferase family protein